MTATTWVEVDLAAIRENATGFRRALGNAELIAVVKANAYGHGVVPVARALTPLAHRYAVATPEEAIELRQAGIEKPILLLYPILPETVDGALEARVEATVAGFADARALAEAATRRGMTIPVHVKINTGMNRYGVQPSDLPSLIEFLRESPGIRIVGFWTHLASADEPDDPQTLAQYGRFAKTVLESPIRRDDALLHVANSAAILNFPHMVLGGARIGISLYGVYSSRETHRTIPLKPALTWKARIARVDTLTAGESVSYNRLFTANRAMRVATLTVGYADGYPRLASNRGSVLIRGQRAAILGRICMDAFVCDVSDIADASYGDVATLIGRDGGDVITADDVADWGETISYEVFTRLGRRVKRSYGNDAISSQIRAV